MTQENTVAEVAAEAQHVADDIAKIAAPAPIPAPKPLSPVEKMKAERYAAVEANTPKAK
jgi:hypothetical protein